tara:strand:+ start:2791 stop:3321 length:531 start_codon:yes stop_codon:yes gene_type:complete
MFDALFNWKKYTYWWIKTLDFLSGMMFMIGGTALCAVLMTSPHLLMGFGYPIMGFFTVAAVFAAIRSMIIQGKKPHGLHDSYRLLTTSIFFGMIFIGTLVFTLYSNKHLIGSVGTCIAQAKGVELSTQATQQVQNPMQAMAAQMIPTQMNPQPQMTYQPPTSTYGPMKGYTINAAK